MFNLFKKKIDLNKLNNIETVFIETIINNLSVKYPLFKQEFELNTFVGIGKNPGGAAGSFTYYINNDSWKKVCDSSIDNYDIKNINFHSYSDNKVKVDLYISEGLIIGYKTSVAVKEIDVTTIDVSKIWEKHFLNKDYSEIEHIIRSLTNVHLRKLNMVKNTFKIEINGSSYFPIHEIEDGNYLAIDKSGSVFKITHDPFEAQKVFDTIFECIDNI